MMGNDSNGLGHAAPAVRPWWQPQPGMRWRFLRLGLGVLPGLWASWQVGDMLPLRVALVTWAMLTVVLPGGWADGGPQGRGGHVHQ